MPLNVQVSDQYNHKKQLTQIKYFSYEKGLTFFPFQAFWPPVGGVSGNVK